MGPPLDELGWGAVEANVLSSHSSAFERADAGGVDRGGRGGGAPEGGVVGVRANVVSQWAGVGPPIVSACCSRFLGLL